MKNNKHMTTPSDKITLSKTGLIRLAVLLTILQPLFAGVFFGIYFMRQRDLKIEGRYILLGALAWSVLVFILVDYLQLKFGAAPVPIR